MRTAFTLGLLLLLVCLFAGCGTATGGRNWPSGNFSVSRGGTLWTPSYAWFYTTSGTLYLWAFETTRGNSPYVEIVVPDATVGSTYTLNKDLGSNAWALYGPDQVSANAFYTYAASGSITLTTLSGSECAGTFNFTARDAASDLVYLTGGSFDVGGGSDPSL